MDAEQSLFMLAVPVTEPENPSLILPLSVPTKAQVPLAQPFETVTSQRPVCKLANAMLF